MYKCDSLIRRLLCLSFPEDNLVTAVCFGEREWGGGGGEGREGGRGVDGKVELSRWRWSDAKLKFQPAFIRDSTRDSGSPQLAVYNNHAKFVSPASTSLSS